jgi:hypothetical protein
MNNIVKFALVGGLAYLAWKMWESSSNTTTTTDTAGEPENSKYDNGTGINEYTAPPRPNPYEIYHERANIEDYKEQFSQKLAAIKGTPSIMVL